MLTEDSTRPQRKACKTSVRAPPRTLAKLDGHGMESRGSQATHKRQCRECFFFFFFFFARKVMLTEDSPRPQRKACKTSVRAPPPKERARKVGLGRSSTLKR